MPWKEYSWTKGCSLWLAGEAMAELCREFGISRKTGYKIFDRYQECDAIWLGGAAIQEFSDDWSVQ